MIKKLLLLFCVLLLSSCTYDVIDDTHIFEGGVNITGDVTILGDINYTTAFAEGFYNNRTNPIQINISVLNTFYNVTGYSIRDSVGFATNGGAYINKSGYYKVAAHIAFSGGNSGEYEVSLFVNDIQNFHCSLYRSTGSSAVGSASFSCIDYYEKGDFLLMKIRDTKSPVQNAQFYYMNFNIFELI